MKQYEVAVGSNVPWAQAMDWCLFTFGVKSFGNTWAIESHGTSAIFSFENEKDMMLFKLKWT